MALMRQIIKGSIGFVQLSGLVTIITPLDADNPDLYSPNFRNFGLGKRNPPNPIDLGN
jgi:hypothetical protein